MSINNFTTLNHLFYAPVPHRRDFVRENRENVSNKLRQTKEKASCNEANAHWRPLHTSSADKISSKSSGFDARMREMATKQQSKQSDTKPRARSPAKKQPWTYGREAADRREALQNTVKIPTTTKPDRRDRVAAGTARDKVLGNNKLKSKSSTIAVQTEEIKDEIYLYNALKKCASPAFKSALKAKYKQKERDTHSKQSLNVSQDSAFPLDYSQELHEHGNDNDEEAAENEEAMERSKAGADKALVIHMPQQTETYHGLQRSTFKHQTSLEQQNHALHSQLNVMTLPADGFNTCSPTKCTNCPVGYHLLSEGEREVIRAKLLDHESLLIRQLNSFPLAIETLRVRQSKTRIEKELTILEQNLRKLTKRKVYAKIHE